MAFKEEIHVLMVSISYQGHINPMLRLGKRLVSKGLHVFACTHRNYTPPDAQGRHQHPLCFSIQLEFFSDVSSLEYDRNSDVDDYFETLAKFGPINLSKLIQDRKEKGVGKFSCLICNPFVPWVADVAVEHGIPCAMMWIQPCTFYAIFYRFYNRLNQFPTLETPEMSVELPGLPLLSAGDLPSFVLPSNPFESYPKLLSDVFQSMKKLKWVLGNSFYELEKDAVESMAKLCPIRAVGPLVPSVLLGEDESADIGVEMWKPEETCLEWLNQQKPCSVVYVSFGSLVVLPAKQMENIATGLKKQ